MESGNGEEKLIAAVRHIAKTLGRTDTMADDILHVFSSFDNRFSLDKLTTTNNNPNNNILTAGNNPNSHNSASTVAHIDRTLRSLDRQISHFISSPTPIWSNSDDSTSFLDSLDDLLATIHDLPPNSTSLLDRADNLLQRSMLRLDDEFRSLILSNTNSDTAQFSNINAVGLSDNENSDEDDDDSTGRIPVARPVESFDLLIDALPPSTVADLHDIARRMVAAGFGRECADAYASARREFIDESVARLGLRCRTPDDVTAASWSELDDEIPRWIKALKMVLLILVPSERRLCERVFASLTPFADVAFVSACRGAVSNILSFADAVAAGARAPERLFRVIDMYEAVREVLPELDVVLIDQYSEPIRADVNAVFKALGMAIRGVFMELENLIRRDPAKAAVPGGGLHPITRYVMNYLRAACASRRTLEEVMEEDGSGAAVATDSMHPSSSLAVQIAWIMDVLQANLDAKAKVYRDPGLCSIFLMNNGKYIIQKVKDSELKGLLGEEWIRRLMSMIRRWGNEYQRGSWSKVVAVLRTDSLGGSGSTSSVATGKAMKERVRAFNEYLEEICKAQGSCVVVDEQLRSELRVAVQELVVPAYRNFCASLRQAGEMGKAAERCLKYSAEEVEAQINALFEGSRRT